MINSGGEAEKSQRPALLCRIGTGAGNTKSKQKNVEEYKMIETNIIESGVEIETSVRESGVRVVETLQSEKITYDEKGREIMLEKEIVVRSAPFLRNRKK